MYFGAEPRFTVTPIGTCRLDGPLRLGADARGIGWNHTRIYGYTHSIAEAVQQVRFLNDEYRPDPELWDLIAKRDLDRVGGERHDPSDLYLVEISSRKQLFIDEHAIQINHLKSKCAPFFEDAARKDRFWNILRENDPTSQRLMIDSCSGSLGLSSDQAHILRRVRLRETTNEELTRGLTYLREALSDPIIVTHVDAVKRDGNRIPNRTRCINQVVAAARELGLTMFDPTRLMNEVGQDRAIEDESESLAHFTDRFSLKLFDAWHKNFLAARIDGGMQASSCARDLAKLETNLRASAALEGPGPAAERIGKLIENGHPRSTDLRTLQMSLYAGFGNFDAARRLAAEAIRNAEANASLVHHATVFAVQRQDTALVKSCVAAAVASGLSADDPWFREAVTALSVQDAPAALQLCATLIEQEPARFADLLTNVATLLRSAPELAGDVDLEKILLATDSNSDAEAVALLISHAKCNQVVHLFRLFSQSADRFWTAISRLLSTGNGATAAAAMRALFTVLARERAHLESHALEMTRDATRSDNAGAKLALLQASLLIKPDQGIAESEMRALRRGMRLRAKALYAAEDMSGLQEIMEIAVRLSPPLDRVPYYLSRLLYAKKDFTQAQSAARTASEWAPDQALNWMMLMRSSIHLGDAMTGEHAAARMLETAPSENERVVEEANRRLPMLRRKLLSHASKLTDPWGALERLTRASKSPELEHEAYEQIARILKLLSDEISKQLRNGLVDVGLDLANRSAPYFAVSEQGRMFAVEAFSTADVASVAVPVVHKLDIGPWQGHDRRRRLARFQNLLLTELQTQRALNAA